MPSNRFNSNNPGIEASVSHLKKVIENGTANFAPDPCAMWMSSIDTRTGRYPENDRRPPGVANRVYRNIGAPRGCTLYWDQPAIAAAHALAALTGDASLASAADACVMAFLQRCISKSGLFFWGNHYYWDAFEGCAKVFYSDEEPQPVDYEHDEAMMHELRPVPPAWEAFWRISPQATERCIRAMGKYYIFDHDTGGFNRHANRSSGHAFLESGGILAESLCWLAKKTGDTALAETALRVAQYSWNHRSEQTGLVINSPGQKRWDGHTCTTEVGAWAMSLLRCFAYTGIAGFADIARNATAAYLRYGYDERAGLYYGRLNAEDGTPNLSPKETVYQPGNYADLWEPLFPTHNYPMSLAEACVQLFEMTGEQQFAQGIARWQSVIEKSLPANEGRGAYAEHYGRCIHFLTRAAAASNDQSAADLARRVAGEAIETLFENRMFRGHPGEHRCDAVDGAGYLMLALIELKHGQEPDGMGFGF